MTGIFTKAVRLALLPALVMLTACAEDDGSGPDASASDHDPTGMEYIKLEQGPCFGSCAVYSITLYGDGRVIFYGSRFTKTHGQASDQTTTGRFLDALEALKQYDFDALEDDYSGKACRIQATDHSVIEITVKSQDYDKHVRWDTGCRGNDDLFRLERLVNDLKWTLQVDNYVGTDAERAPTKRSGLMPPDRPKSNKRTREDRRHKGR
ncbi:DUF6438 domain-containing protein [Kordiimonas marina]|uniref:DUF6438 domain-containing protein n=1 Tax=Kordiimonas marina TaxID=2872312 RepID=UPI001FF10DAB|nr:DUF6438 domain-containing protein [Kordiimonas marina]MCJ9428708.1 DUF6438 domain-containing protein [Kordiimonas marina]